MAHLFKMEAANLNAFMTELAKAGMTAELAEKLRNDSSRMKSWVASIKVKVAVIFTILVNYVQPKLADLKSAFDWVNDGFTRAEFHPIVQCKDVSLQAREVTFGYMTVNRMLSTEAVLTKMDRQGLRPALYEELLAFAKANPNEQRKRFIVAIGSVTQVAGYCFVAYLDEDDSGRYLDLRWFDDGHVWSSFCVFLVVRK